MNETKPRPSARIMVRLKFGQINLGRKERYWGEISDMLALGGWYNDGQRDQDIWDSKTAPMLAEKARLDSNRKRFFKETVAVANPNPPNDDKLVETMCEAYQAKHRTWLYVLAMHAALDAIKPEIERRVAEARNAALEEAAAKIDQIGDQLYQEWRATRKSDQHLEGQADASDEYAEAVRALKS